LRQHSTGDKWSTETTAFVLDLLVFDLVEQLVDDVPVDVLDRFEPPLRQNITFKYLLRLPPRSVLL
jgi:hypothetical protein